MKFKSYLLIFIASTLIFTSSLFATDTTNAIYKQTVTTYIEQLSVLQNQIFTLAQKATFSSANSDSTFNSELDAMYSTLDQIYGSMTIYYNSLPAKSIERRNLLILFNAINLLRGSLFQFDELSNTESSLEKMILLENYFGFKIEANDTINKLF